MSRQCFTLVSVRDVGGWTQHLSITGYKSYRLCVCANLTTCCTIPVYYGMGFFYALNDFGSVRDRGC